MSRTRTGPMTAVRWPLMGLSVTKEILNQQGCKINMCFSSRLLSVTPCFQPSACLLTATHWSIPLIKMATATSWQNQILTLQTRRNSSWTAGPANPFPAICTGPVCMRGCCWPYTTEVRRSRNTLPWAVGETWNEISNFSRVHATWTNICRFRSASAEDLRRPSHGDRRERLLHGASLPWRTEGRLVLRGFGWRHACGDCSQARMVSAPGLVVLRCAWSGTSC